jgi:hypothetical protein
LIVASEKDLVPAVPVKWLSGAVTRRNRVGLYAAFGGPRREGTDVEANCGREVSARRCGAGTRKKAFPVVAVTSRFQSKFQAETSTLNFDLTVSPAAVVGGASKLRRLGEIDLEAVAPSLIFAGHLRTGVAELLLQIVLVDLGRSDEEERPAAISEI